MPGRRAAPSAQGRSVAFRRCAAFTLIELMVAVAIVAILAAIAVPSYTQWIQRSARNDAKATLALAAQAMEGNRTVARSYLNAPDGSTLALSSGLSRSPASGTQRYTIALGNQTAATYALTATPTGPQATDECGALRVDHTGARCLVDSNVAAGDCTGHPTTGDLFARCWGR